MTDPLDKYNRHGYREELRTPLQIFSPSIAGPVDPRKDPLARYNRFAGASNVELLSASGIDVTKPPLGIIDRMRASFLADTPEELEASFKKMYPSGEFRVVRRVFGYFCKI